MVLNIINNFLEPNWLYAMILLIPFILLYLFKPKPSHKMIPSLMFLFKNQGKNRKNNFLRRFVQDILFILQLLILLLLLLSIAKPFVNVSKESLFKNTVIVLDVSASMKADYQRGSRFDEGVKLVKNNLGKSNTLILVKKNPEVVLVEQSASEVKDYLKGLEATDTSSNLYDGISIAGGYSKTDSRIVVISDFIDTETDTGILTAKKTLEAQGIKVDFLSVFEKVSNIGIIDLSVDETKTRAIIKNYDNETKNIVVKVGNLEESLSIAGKSQEIFTFITPHDTSKIEIKDNKNDGFKVDDVAYISSLSKTKKKVLLITNNNDYKKTYIYNVFDVMNNIYMDVAVPPKIPDLKGVKKEVEKGKSAVIASQSNILSIDYQGLFPLIPKEMVTRTSTILAGNIERITENIEFGFTKKYLITDYIEGRNNILIAATDDKNLLISFSNLGEGKIFYYGLLDEDDDAEVIFGKSPSYYVFWKRLSDFATNTPSIKDLNYRTGNSLIFNKEQTIQTSEGKIKTNSLELKNSGLYTFNDRTIAINLLNEKESDVSNDFALSEEGIAQSSEKFKDKTPYEITDYLIIIALIILFVELIYVKLRGDF